MPTLVKEHKRKGGDVVAHIRAGTYPVIIDGRTFGIYMGAGDFDTTLVNMKQAKNMRKKLKDAVIVDGMYAL